MKKKVILTISLILIILIIGVFSYIKFGGYIILDKQEREELVAEIKSSPQLPERFYEIYNVMKPNSLNPTSWLHFINHQANSKVNTYCACREAVYAAIYPGEVDAMIIMPTINFVERNTSQKECLSFYIKKKAWYLNPNPLLNKDINKMNDYEMVGLILTIDNPTLYDRTKYPDKLEEKINEVLNKL